MTNLIDKEKLISHLNEKIKMNKEILKDACIQSSLRSINDCCGSMELVTRLGTVVFTCESLLYEIEKGNFDDKLD